MEIQSFIKTSYTFTELEKLAEDFKLYPDFWSDVSEVFDGEGHIYLHFGDISFELADEIRNKFKVLKNNYEIFQTDGFKTCLFSVRIDSLK